MNNTFKRILALIYVSLVFFGLLSIAFGETLNSVGRVLYVSALIIFSIMFMFVLREEEDEELTNK